MFILGFIKYVSMQSNDDVVNQRALLPRWISLVAALTLNSGNVDESLSLFIGCLERNSRFFIIPSPFEERTY